jgi:hypothetical protein
MSLLDKLFRPIEPKIANHLEIPKDRYAENSSLKTFDVPAHIIQIGPRAFQKCINLRSVTMTPSLRKIDISAFAGCTSLTEIIIPDGVNYLGNDAFSNCSSLREAVLPESLAGTKLGRGLFYGCRSLEKITLPDCMTGDFSYAFTKCEKLAGVRIPKGISEIGESAFECCTALQAVTIPDTVKAIGSKAFLGCASLREISLPDSVETISAFRAFKDCKALETVRFPVGITMKRAFENRDDEKDAFACCFKGCDALKTVVLGDRSFALSEPLNDRQMYLFHAELAAAGDQKAQQYTAQNPSE